MSPVLARINVSYRSRIKTQGDLFDYPSNRADKEEIVKFLHARLPSVPIKVIRANTYEPEAKVFRMRSGADQPQLIGAVVFKDHDSAEFREVKYFCTAYPGGGIGTRLMNSLKEDAVTAKLFFIVLYASNTAVTFFSKQAFVNFPEKTCGLSKTVVLSRVEQYQRSTLMACDLIEHFPMSYKWMRTKLKEGDFVFVSHGMRHARDEEAFVVERSGLHKVKVRYPKWTNDTDEWIVVGAQRMKKKAVDDLIELADEESLFSRIKKIRIV